MCVVPIRVSIKLVAHSGPFFSIDCCLHSFNSLDWCRESFFIFFGLYNWFKTTTIPTDCVPCKPSESIRSINILLSIDMYLMWQFSECYLLALPLRCDHVLVFRLSKKISFIGFYACLLISLDIYRLSLSPTFRIAHHAHIVVRMLCVRLCIRLCVPLIIDNKPQ